MLELKRRKLAHLLDVWDDFVDSRVGIVREVYGLPIDQDDPNFFHYLSTACDTSTFASLKNFGNNGGVSTDRYTAIAKALGEALERYCSAIFAYDDLRFAAYSELDGRATPPTVFALYRPEQLEREQLPWKPFLSTTRISWTPGVSALTGEEVLLPAAMVYVPYHYTKERGDAPIVQPISTGLALGGSFAQALLGGMCEVIERDAFTVTWQASLSPPRLEVDSLPPSCRALIGRFEAVGIDVMLMDMTSDIHVPTTLAVALGHTSTSPALAVAAATDPSAEHSIIKALEELAHTRKFAKQLMEYTPEVLFEPAQGHPAIRDQKDHLRLYCAQASKRHAEFLWSSTTTRRFESMADHSGEDEASQLAAVTNAVAKAGFEPISCDLTTPDVATLGMYCVRAVIPGMHPLFMGHCNRALGGSRLYEVPTQLGSRGLEPGEPDNPAPHPFP